MSAVVLTLPVALFLAAVHVLSARLTHLDPVPRSAWLSFGGGVSVAYVFMHVIPELAAHEDKLRDQGSALAAETQVFAMALAGLVAFYGLERMARVSSRGEARAAARPCSGSISDPSRSTTGSSAISCSTARRWT
jgi:zinc transporter ZupT